MPDSPDPKVGLMVDALLKIRDRLSQGGSLDRCSHLRDKDPGGCPWDDDHAMLAVIDTALGYGSHCGLVFTSHWHEFAPGVKVRPMDPEDMWDDCLRRWGEMG